MTLRRYLSILLIAVVAFGIVAVLASAASARPVPDDPKYYGPGAGTASWFAGISGNHCAPIDRGVFRNKPKACGG